MADFNSSSLKRCEKLKNIGIRITVTTNTNDGEFTMATLFTKTNGDKVIFNNPIQTVKAPVAPSRMKKAADVAAVVYVGLALWGGFNYALNTFVGGVKAAASAAKASKPSGDSTPDESAEPQVEA